MAILHTKISNLDIFHSNKNLFFTYISLKNGQNQKSVLYLGFFRNFEIFSHIWGCCRRKTDFQYAILHNKQNTASQKDAQ